MTKELITSCLKDYLLTVDDSKEQIFEKEMQIVKFINYLDEQGLLTDEVIIGYWSSVNLDEYGMS